MLTGANLDGAILDGADLTLATLNGVRVAGADFTDTLWSKTSLARAVGIESASGLDRLRFGDPSSIDVHTLREQPRRVAYRAPGAVRAPRVGYPGPACTVQLR